MQLIIEDNALASAGWRIVKYNCCHPSGYWGMVTEFFKDGVLKRVDFRTDGKLHRDHNEGPAMIKHGIRENVTMHQYYKNGQLHRPASAGPAWISWHQDGTLRIKCWYEDDILIKQEKGNE